MQKLKKELVTLLKGVCPNVYFENAFDTSSTPYLVYDLTQGVEREGQMIWNLDIDVWDRNSSSLNVDDLCKKLRALDRTSHIDDKIQFSMHLDRIINTKSESKEWKRKTVIFELRYMERE